MSIKENIEKELKSALINKDDFKKDALRFLLSAVQNKEIEKRGSGKGDVLTEEEMIDLLRKELKKRKESAEVYKQSGRTDLMEKEEKEANIIESFLPQEIKDEELEKIVDEIIVKNNASSLKDLGNVIKGVKEIVGQNASSSRIAEMVKKKLSG